MVNSEQHIVGGRHRITISWLAVLLLASTFGKCTAWSQSRVAPAEVLVCWEPGRAKANTSAEARRLAAEFGILDEVPLWPGTRGRAKANQGPGELGAWTRLTFSAAVDPHTLAEAYAGLEGVRWAQPNYLRRPASAPNDSLFDHQWSLPAIGWSWDEGRAPEEVVVAIIDSGVDWRHPDLDGQIWQNPAEVAGVAGVDDDGNGYVDDVRGWDFSDAPGMPGEGDYLNRDADPDDESGHGTHVAGIVGALPGNHIGIAGVAPGARLMVLRAGFNIGGAGFLQDDDVAAAIVYAADQGARVVNMSFGDPNFSPLIRDVILYAKQAGCTLVGAAGNESSEAVFYPARLPEVIAVGATGREQGGLAFSNYGYSLDLAAPGLGIVSLLPKVGYGERSGTSMAAAQVSGLAALVLGRHPEFSPAQVRGALVQTAQDLGAPGWDLRTGAGLAQATAAGQANPATLELVADAGFGAGILAVLTLTGEGSFDAAWSSGAGIGPWVELERGGVSGSYRNTLAWPPPGLADGQYLLRARLFIGGGVWEERLALDLQRQPLPAKNLAIHRALDGEVWAQVAEWESVDGARDTVLIYAQHAEQPWYVIAENSSRRIRWLQLPEDLAPGAYRARIGGSGPEVEFAVESDPVQRWGFEERGVLPEGYLLPVFPDYSGNGRRELVAMRVLGSRYNPVDYFEAAGTTPVHSSSLLFIPWAQADLDGDGLQELVGVDAQRVRLIEAPAPGTFPSSSVWQQLDTWGGEVADLDGDGIAELLLRSARAAIFQVYEGRGNNHLGETALLANPTSGSNEAGERQVAADLDGDGMGELLTGDEDGDLWIHEAIGNDAYRLTWQEDAAPSSGDARLVGGGVDLDGDGRLEFAVGRLYQDPYDLRQTRWSLEIYEAKGDNRFGREWQVEALGGKAGANGINSADWNGDGLVDLVVALPPNLYVFTAEGTNSYRPVWQSAAGDAHQPAAGDLDGDGRAELAFNTGRGLAIFSRALGLVPPALLKARPLDAQRIHLSWAPAMGASGYRVYRDGVRLGDTVDRPEFEDRGLSPAVEYTYQVTVVQGEVESTRSAEMRVRPQAPPRVLGVERVSAAGLGLFFDQPMAEAEPFRFQVAPEVGMPSSVLLDRGGRRMVLGFEGVLPDSGRFTLSLRGISSGVGGNLDLEGIPFALTPRYEPTRVTGAEVLDPGRVALRFSAPVTSAEPAHFTIGGSAHVVVGVEGRGSELILAVEPPLRPLGMRYTLEVAGVLSAGGDLVEGRVLLELAVADLEQARFFPNPFRVSAGRGVFGFLPPTAEVQVFDLEGRLQFAVAERDGDGGVSWDGRGADGDLLPSGVYLYRIRSGNAQKRGKLALIRD